MSIKFKEQINVFAHENSDDIQYQINADRWIDFSAKYTFTNSQFQTIGMVQRKGMRSLWKAHYQVFGANENASFDINEENGWIKVLDGFLGEIPILGIFTGYFLNPTYSIKRSDGTLIGRFSKESSLIGRKFSWEQITPIANNEEEQLMLSLLMFVFLERSRG